MRLTTEEKEICKRSQKRRSNGLVGCPQCPLVLDRRLCLCKKNVTKKEYEELKE